MPTTDLHRWLIAILATLTLQACAINENRGDAPFQISEDYANNVIRYTVQRGDRLSDIALEFTGSLSTWLPIAEHNGITDPKALRVGSQLEIPTALIPGYEEARLNRRNQLRKSDTRTVESSQVTQAASEDTSAAKESRAETAINESIPSAGSGKGEENKTETPLIRIEREPQKLPQVRVVGTYYPKGVYAQPTLDSRLMMRVAPGSVFALAEQMNGWFRIETDRGQGFVRDRDARIIDAQR